MELNPAVSAIARFVGLGSHLEELGVRLISYTQRGIPQFRFYSPFTRGFVSASVVEGIAQRVLGGIPLPSTRKDAARITVFETPYGSTLTDILNRIPPQGAERINIAIDRSGTEYGGWWSTGWLPAGDTGKIIRSIEASGVNLANVRYITYDVPPE